MTSFKQQAVSLRVDMHGNCSSPVMAATVQQTWQLLLPMHGNQLLSVPKLGFYINGSCSPTYMANTVANTWQPVYSSIKTLYSRLELTRQMRSTISAAHMLLAIGKSRRQYMSHCTRPLVSVFCLIFSTITATNLLFLTCYSHKNKCSAVFVVQIPLPCCAACAHLVWSVTPN